MPTPAVGNVRSTTRGAGSPSSGSQHVRLRNFEDSYAKRVRAPAACRRARPESRIVTISRACRRMLADRRRRIPGHDAQEYWMIAIAAGSIRAACDRWTVDGGGGRASGRRARRGHVYRRGVARELPIPGAARASIGGPGPRALTRSCHARATLHRCSTCSRPRPRDLCLRVVDGGEVPAVRPG